MLMPASSPIRGRLAPSPTGALHLGNARSFLLAWLSVRSRGGTVVMRIEDLDHPKVKPWAVSEILDDLRWLGLDWDEGPDVGGALGPYVQRERCEQYAAALEVLKEKGQVYPCVCSRRDVESAQAAPHAEDYQRYPGTCQGRFGSFADARAFLPSERLPAWRFQALDEAVGFEDGFCGYHGANVAQRDGDFVLARDAQGAGYMLAVVVDDAAMGITEVLRGDDLLPATHRQLLLYRALGLEPPRFVHVPLVVGPDGKRLAKRHGDTRLRVYREQGIAPERITGFLAWSCGLIPFGMACRPTELIADFSLDKLPHEPLVLTPELVEQAGLSV
ncbi:MAG: tRNA glutamyl-Q(34) synthetase GluQRS [Kiritimatiellia bacterium]